MHPSEVLFQGKRQPLLLAACDHYAGSEKLMRKSIALQQELGPLFDITFDCEDGASAGNEESHAHMIAGLLASDENQFNRIGVRVHDVDSPFFARDVEIICAAASRLAYIAEILLPCAMPGVSSRMNRAVAGVQCRPLAMVFIARRLLRRSRMRLHPATRPIVARPPGCPPLQRSMPAALCLPWRVLPRFCWRRTLLTRADASIASSTAAGPSGKCSGMRCDSQAYAE